MQYGCCSTLTARLVPTVRLVLLFYRTTRLVPYGTVGTRKTTLLLFVRVSAVKKSAVRQHAIPPQTTRLPTTTAAAVYVLCSARRDGNPTQTRSRDVTVQVS